jgi:hypothetical protein
MTSSGRDGVLSIGHHCTAVRAYGDGRPAATTCRDHDGNQEEEEEQTHPTNTIRARLTRSFRITLQASLRNTGACQVSDTFKVSDTSSNLRALSRHSGTTGAGDR